MHSLSKFAKRNPIKKADTSNSDNIAWDQLMAIADQLNPQVQQSFLNSVDALKTNIDSAGVVAALKHASPVEIADAILDLVMGGFDGLQSSLEQVIADAIMGVSNTKAFDIAVDVTPGAPSANQFINNYSLGRVQQITDEQRQLLQSKIKQGIDDGLNPVEVARQIRPYIGLTVNQANAVDNYRGMLETLDPQALTRKLRDSRFDNTIRNAISGNNPLVDDQIDYIVGRYAARALQHRAKTIGRTESMNALHQAQNYLWQQASDSGAVMASDLYRYWHVAHDERTCPICKPIPELNPEGVPLNGQFNTPVGLVDGPGMHPNCRCVVFTRPHISSLYNTNPSQLVDDLKSRDLYPDDDSEDIDTESDNTYKRLSKYNHNHDPHSGEFASDDSQEFHLPAGGPDAEFTPKASLTRYIQSGNGAINGLLRGVSRNTLDGTEPNEIRALDNLFDNTPPLPKMTVYRGLTVNGVKRLTGNGELVDAIGTVVSDPAFISTSKDKEVAQDFSTNISADAHGMRGFMTISLPKGSNGVNVARTINSKSGWDATEKEILLPRGSKFRITAINVRTDPKFGDKVVHIKADWLGSERKPIPEKDSVVMLKSLQVEDRFAWDNSLNIVLPKHKNFDRLSKFYKGQGGDPYHDPHNGQFTTGPGGSDESVKTNPLSEEHKKKVSWLLDPTISERVFPDAIRSGDLKHIFNSDLNSKDKRRLAVKLYTGSGSFPINQYLRYDSIKEMFKDYKDVVPKAIPLLDEAIDNSVLSRPKKLYRGLSQRAMADDLKFEVGDTFHDEGYVSTTTKKNVADQYFGDYFNTSPTKSGIMIITVPKGEKALDVNAVDEGNMHSPENEFILPRGSNFKITRIDDTSSDTNKFIYATLEPPTPKRITKALDQNKEPEEEHKFIWGANHFTIVLAKYTRGNPYHASNGEFTTGGNSSPHMMSVEHYSPVANLDMLDPRKAGTGRAGRERKRKDRVDAVHVYDSKNAKLEQQFRHDYRYTGEIPTASIYDIAKDPDHIVPRSGVYDATKLELAIKNHGYMGFKNSASQNPSIIKLFYSLKVNPSSPRQYRGMRFGSPHSMNQRVVALKSWILHRISEKHLYLSAQ